MSNSDKTEKADCPEPKPVKYDPATDPARTLYERRVYPSLAEIDLSFLQNQPPFSLALLRENAPKQEEEEGMSPSYALESDRHVLSAS